MKEFYSGLQSLCVTPTAREILEIVKLNCPINKYPEIEEKMEKRINGYAGELKTIRADEEDAEERKQYEQVESSVDYNSGPP